MRRLFRPHHPVLAIARLAPHANDSGHRRGKRSIWGGRDALRRSLYLAALTASRFDPRFRAFKERLLAAGKARKLVIVACARKLLTVLNAMMRTGTAY
ncbi:transposase [Cereibacter sphaeroides]|uniref:transposase n=1 Tax=Cereibacter sphaeroides TaxID=1063 RepID=UPI003AF11B58|nr:transposase [Cereibacter sphaeroides]